jgi:uncharacterized membrane protein
MKASKLITISYVFIIFLFVGIFLFATFLLRNLVLTVVGLCFLVASIIGLALVRRKVSILKRANPEVMKALKAEASTSIKEKTLSLHDLPLWLTVLLIIVVVVGFLGADLHLFAFSPVLEAVLSVITVFFLVFYFTYKRKLMKKKYPESDGSARSKRHETVW